MAPKLLDPPHGKKRLEMKTAAKIVEESKTAKSLQLRKNELKHEIQKLAVLRKAAQRKARNLKKKGLQHRCFRAYANGHDEGFRVEQSINRSHFDREFKL